MSKKEGELLKRYIKANSLNIDKFAKDAGFSQRQGLYYQFQQDEFTPDVRNKIEKALGFPVKNLYTKENSEQLERENELLVELSESRKRIIDDRDKYADVYQTIINKLINNEAWAQVIVHRLADLTQLLMGDRVDKKMIEAQSNEEVEMISRELLKRLKDESR